jgi:hypothetical protein
MSEEPNKSAEKGEASLDPSKAMSIKKMLKKAEVVRHKDKGGKKDRKKKRRTYNKPEGG